MGQAYVSIADDTSAMFWNPAGLGGINNMQVEMMYAKKYLGIDDDNLSDWYLGYVLPIGEIGSIGVGDLLFTSGKYKENTGVISYGKQLGNISCGVSIKLMSVIEAVMDIGSHTVKNPRARPSSYKDIARLDNIRSSLPNLLPGKLLKMAGYRNRMVHFYGEITERTVRDYSEGAWRFSGFLQMHS